MNCMFGTAHWCGTYEGNPALTLSYYGGAKLWVFEEGKWIVKLSSNEGRADLDKKLGIPWGEEENIHALPIEKQT